MKSFTSAILAAAVSANYCYEDGCNCNGETRACYSVPRQNMRPNAINTCCPVGVQPTVYGINNGRSVNIPQTASLTNINTNPAFFGTSSGNSIKSKLVATCAETFQASNCSSVAAMQRKACEKARADARTECEKTSADERTETEKTAADERKEAEKTSADERKEAEKAAADERVTSALLFGGCQDIDTSATVTGADGTTCFTVKETGVTLTLAPASPDMTFQVYLQGSQNNVILGNGVTGVNFDKLYVQGNMNHAALSPESTINQVSMKGSNVKITGNPTYCKTGKIAGTPRTFNATQSPEVCAQYSSKSNLLKGETEATWSPTSNLGLIGGAIGTAVDVAQNDPREQECVAQMQATDCTMYKTKDARKNCEKDKGDVRKECSKAAGDARKAEEKAKYGLTLSNWVDCRDYNLYCCQEWNRFEWECITQDLPASSTSCTDVVNAARSAGITADYPGTCISQTASLANTLVNVTKSPNTTCISGCGTTKEVNVETRGNSCQSSNYRYKESATNSQCNSDCACDNTRTCSSYGWCQY